MKSMKRWICLVLSVCMAATLLSACGEEEDGPGSSTGSSTTSSTVTPATMAPSPTPEQTAKEVMVKADDGLNVRDKASTDGTVLGLAKNNSKLALLVEDEKDGWYQVSYGGKTAYVYAEYVDVVDVTLDEYNNLKAEAGSSRGNSSSAGSNVSSSQLEGEGSSALGGQDSQDRE